MRFEPRNGYAPVHIPAAISDRPSVLAFSMAKAGSTLLNNILSRISPDVELTYFSIEDYLFSRNVSPTNRPTNIGKIIKPEGYCYGGFRQFPAHPVPILFSARSVLLVRNPLDMITSLYFSLLKSHRIPRESGASSDVNGAASKMITTRRFLQQTDINAFARQAVRTYTRMFEGYVAQGFPWRKNVAIYRYEDVVFHKASWISDICAWYGWTLAPGRAEAVAAMFDQQPETERPEHHVRQVKPGNHLVHLSAQTVTNVGEGLAEYMRIFGYQP